MSGKFTNLETIGSLYSAARTIRGDKALSASFLTNPRATLAKIGYDISGVISSKVSIVPVLEDDSVFCFVVASNPNSGINAEDLVDITAAKKKNDGLKNGKTSSSLSTLGSCVASVDPGKKKKAHD